MTRSNDGPGEHLGEMAELYALGALDRRECEAVDAHAARCAPCSRALGEATATVAALDGAFVPQRSAPPRLGARITASARAAGRAWAPRTSGPRAWYATAAALVLAIAGGGAALVQRDADSRQAAHDSAILASIANSHFNHVTLQSHAPRVPVSKVLYARDGAWWYLIVDSPTCECRVVARTATGTRNLGAPSVRGSTSTLFVNDVPRPASVALVDSTGRILSEVPLVYPPK